MKKIAALVFAIAIVVVGCNLFRAGKPSQQERIDQLEKKILKLEKTIAMGVATQAGASIYPVTGALTGGGTGALDKITATVDKDAAIVMFNDEATFGNAFIPYSLDADGAGTESVPYLIDSGDGGNEDWEWMDIYGRRLFGNKYYLSVTDSCTIGVDCDGTRVRLGWGGVIENTVTAKVIGLPEIAATPTAIQVPVGAHLWVVNRDASETTTIDPNANDSITLFGTKGAAGNYIINIATAYSAGDFVHLVATAVDNWTVWEQKGGWVPEAGSIPDIRTVNMSFYDDSGNSPSLVFSDDDEVNVSLFMDDTLNALVFKEGTDADDYLSFTVIANVPTFGVGASGQLNLVADTFILGNGTDGKDYSLKFDGNEDEAFLTWTEDEFLLKLSRTNANGSFLGFQIVDDDTGNFYISLADLADLVTIYNAGPIAFYASGDADDYLQFSVVGNVPYITAPNGDLINWDDTNLVTSGYISSHVQAIQVSTCEGQHDGDNNASTLTDGGETWTSSAYIGMTLINVTDGSSCTVTANDGTTMTCTLTGGTDNDWDTNDYWAVAPGPHQSGNMVYISSATTIMHPATSGYAVCYYSTGANAVKVDPLYTDAAASTMRLWLDGTDTGTDGDELDSASAAGDFICIHNVSATVGRTLGRSGTWTDGGAS